MNEGMTVIDACQEIGIPRSSFYCIVQKTSLAIAEFQDIIDARNLHQLGLILQAKAEILREVIEDDISTTKSRDRMAIYKFACYLDITPNLMFSLYEYLIPGKGSLPLCEEHAGQLEKKEVVLYDKKATEALSPDHCWVCK